MSDSSYSGGLNDVESTFLTLIDTISEPAVPGKCQTCGKSVHESEIYCSTDCRVIHTMCSAPHDDRLLTKIVSDVITLCHDVRYSRPDTAAVTVINMLLREFDLPDLTTVFQDQVSLNNRIVNNDKEVKQVRARAQQRENRLSMELYRLTTFIEEYFSNECFNEGGVCAAHNYEEDCTVAHSKKLKGELFILEDCEVCSGTGNGCENCMGDCYDGPHRLCEYAGEIKKSPCDECNSTGKVPKLKEII